jgi:F-type H+-transporting ATPase subunit epsilon
VTAERVVFSEEADMVVAPSIEGTVGILPQHAPLMSVLGIGELRIKRGSEETSMAIGGGFMEVLNDRVTVLADTAEREDEIDLALAEQARERAEQLRSHRGEEFSPEAMQATLRRAQVRLKVAGRRRRRGSQGDRADR